MVQEGIYRLKNVRSGTYLDASIQKKNVVHGWDSRPENKNQQWEIRRSGDKYTIKNVGNGDYINVWNTNDRTDVKVKDDPTPVRFEEHDGAYAIYLDDSQGVIDLDQGRDENGTDINVWRFSGAKQQLWRLEGVGSGYQSQSGVQPRGESSYSAPPQQDNYRGAVNPGTYYIRNVHTGTALDLAGGASTDGTKVIGYSAGSGNNQKWTLEPGSRGYRLKNAQSGTYAGFQSHESPTDGVLLTGNRNAPEWDVKQADQGYQFFIPGTNYVLDLASGDRSDGAKICLWTNKGENNQKWNLQQA
ncbi:hypothetical protein FRC03_011340 [Tulasnella sp. 419]|nr:hypothetical protein FRC02_002108 [Tulasnella sp. 418]KAG8955004.1 hypothetical protein FRC03_011340 [Tulasnella sp. 419]